MLLPCAAPAVPKVPRPTRRPRRSDWPEGGEARAVRAEGERRPPPVRHRAELLEGRGCGTRSRRLPQPPDEPNTAFAVTRNAVIGSLSLDPILGTTSHQTEEELCPKHRSEMCRGARRAEWFRPPLPRSHPVTGPFDDGPLSLCWPWQ